MVRKQLGLVIQSTPFIPMEIFKHKPQQSEKNQLNPYKNFKKKSEKFMKSHRHLKRLAAMNIENP
jgi:hypothetical protein